MVGIFLSLLDIIGHRVFSWYKQQTEVTAVSLGVCFHKHTSRHYKYLDSINYDSLLRFSSSGFTTPLPSPQHGFTQGGETQGRPRHIKHRQEGSPSLLFTSLAQDLKDVFICFKAPFLFLEVNLPTITSSTVDVHRSADADRRTSKWPTVNAFLFRQLKTPSKILKSSLSRFIERGKALVYKHFGNWRAILQKTQFISTFLLRTFLDSPTNFSLGI